MRDTILERYDRYRAINMRHQTVLAKRLRKGPLASAAQYDMARRILAFIEKGKLEPGFTARTIHKSGWTGTDNPALINDALELLIEKGRLRCETPQRDGGGRPSNKYFLRTE